mgnify:CR=1 FL=1
MTSNFVDATSDIYHKITEVLRPTPAKSHYTFNLWDVSKVFQGILMASPQLCNDKMIMIRLWIHECMRVFHDWLATKDDREWFKTYIIELIEEQFKEKFEYKDIFEEK